MALLYINADDFGLHREIDRGIVECIDAGRVTGLSLSPNGSSLDWQLARELASRVDVGIHVTLVGEPWLTDSRTFASWTRLIPWLLLPGRSALLEREIRRQIESMLDKGIQPTHLDSHQHVHVMSPIWPLCRRLMAEYRIPRIRVPATASRSTAKPSLAGRVLQRLSERRAVGVPGALACTGIAFAGHNTADILVREIEASAGRDVELVAHPAIDTPALRDRYGSWKFDWDAERNALLSDTFGNACARLGYRIARLGQHA